MQGRFSNWIDKMLHRRVMRRWGLIAERSAATSLETLRGQRSRARALRRNLDKVIHQAEHRLSLPVIGSNVIRKPDRKSVV